MTSAKISDFLTPPVRKFMQPPLLRLLTMSAFVGTPSPLKADVITGSPLGKKRGESRGGSSRKSTAETAFHAPLPLQRIKDVPSFFLSLFVLQESHLLWFHSSSHCQGLQFIFQLFNHVQAIDYTIYS